MSNTRAEQIKEKLRERNAKREASPLEKWVRHWLPVARLYDYELEYQVEQFFIDIAWPKLKLAIELDGWAYHKDKLERDKKRDQFLNERGWQVIRIPSKECWNPKRLGLHLKRIKNIVNPYTTISFGLAELLDIKPEQLAASARLSEEEQLPTGNCKACDLPIYCGNYCPECKGIYQDV
jgi:very-short-patch-repair endonuclease